MNELHETDFGDMPSERNERDEAPVVGMEAWFIFGIIIVFCLVIPLAAHIWSRLT